MTDKITITKEQFLESISGGWATADSLWASLANRVMTPEDHFNEWLSSLQSDGVNRYPTPLDIFTAGFNIGRRK